MRQMTQTENTLLLMQISTIQKNGEPPMTHNMVNE